ncbi:hypothetical protein [Gluconobacter morbifer]|nr:hypothetical protein [Gluconobacter morbifer]
MHLLTAAASCGNWLALSPAGAGNSVGIPWWIAVTGSRSGLSILDCGASPAIARNALEAGIGWVVCRGAQAQIRALQTVPAYRERILPCPPPSRPVSFWRLNGQSAKLAP